ncbi:MAG: glycosyl transferase [Spirosomaceae bacterium]|nr:glycosyl transferase [Spirosomataceae bacterium]
MKYAFIIQGEGRGHLTQAIALSEILTTAGHEVGLMLVGTAEGGEVPAFFKDKVVTNIISFQSPCLVYCKKTKALDVNKTLINSFLGFRGFIHSIHKIQKSIKHYQPDIIINFYDVLGGFYNLIYNQRRIPFICTAHQYLLLHPSFEHPKCNWIDKFLVNLNTRITALWATKKLALSFTPFADDSTQNIVVVPPLLRSDFSKLNPKNEGFILAYMTQSSLVEDLIKWHEVNPEVRIHCFTDREQDQAAVDYSENLTFHEINGSKFLEFMQNCWALVTTAGFESVCEAMYLGKPVMMVPVPKHFEQACNAADAQRAKAGVAAQTFDLDILMNYLPTHRDIGIEFREWQSKSERIFLREIGVSLLSRSIVESPEIRLDWQI